MNSTSDRPPVGILLDRTADLTLLMSLMVDTARALECLHGAEVPSAVAILQGVLLALGKTLEEREVEVEQYLETLSKTR